MTSRIWSSLLLGSACGTIPALGWGLLGSSGPPGVAPAHARTTGDHASSILAIAESPSVRSSASSLEEGNPSLEVIKMHLESARPADQMRYLHELVAIGTPEAMDLLFDRLAADPDAFGSEAIWELLFGVDDPRVYELARTQFERAMAEGLAGGRFMTGYLKLIASHGAREGADLILTQVVTEGNIRSSEAARAIGYLKDHSNSDVYLDQLMVSDGRNQRVIGRALAHWNEPGVTEELYAIARSKDVHPTYRRSILRGFGENARDVAGMDAVISHYWSAGDDESWVEVALSGIQALQTNRYLDDNQVSQRTAAVLYHVLGTDSWLHGVQLVANHAHLRTPEAKAALEALLDTLEDAEARAIVKMELLRFP